jgi:hypothetical protein
MKLLQWVSVLLLLFNYLPGFHQAETVAHKKAYSAQKIAAKKLYGGKR